MNQTNCGFYQVGNWVLYNYDVVYDSLVRCGDMLNVYVYILSVDMDICWFICKLIGMVLWEGLSLFKKGTCHLLSKSVQGCGVQQHAQS